MDANRKSLLWTGGKLALTAALLASAAGVAFAGWLNHADGIFMSMIDAGLSWCM